MALADLQKLTPKQSRFLKCFEMSSSVTQAARWAKVSRQMHYDWMEESEAYKSAFAKSEKKAARTLEDEAVRRAHRGVRKAIRYKGKVVGYEDEYSDTLMSLLLKGNAPDKFRDKLPAELPNSTSSEINLTVIVQMIMQELADAPPELRARLGQRLKALSAVSE